MIFVILFYKKYNLTGKIPTKIGQLVKLNNLSLSNNNLTGKNTYRNH